MKGVLLRFCFGCFLVTLVLYANAQNFRFIYIQTENQKPFYVKMGDHGISSSASGYMIIPRLTAETYKITVGLPQSSFPEFSFTVNLKETGTGYLIKKDADRGWYIADLYTMEPVEIEVQLSSLKGREAVKLNYEFARILSEVVNDSTIREMNVFSTQGAITAKPEAVNAPNMPVVEKPEPANYRNPAIVNASKATVSKLGQRNISEGLFATYLDNGDTVNIFMPVNRVHTMIIREQKPDSFMVVKRETDSLRNIRFIDMELQNPNQQANSGTIKKDDFVIKEKKNTAAHGIEIKKADSILVNPGQPNTTCKKTATKSDFLQLRKAMAAEKTAADMQSLAANEFRNICFSTEQVKHLGVLFITEEERYKFYEASYPYVLDAANFATLESQLADSYYITRFKAMLNH